MKITAPSATPFPVPSFDGSDNDASLERFLDFLRTLVSQYLSDNAPRIPRSNRDAWITVINGLTDHLLTTFPTPGIVSWGALQEKVTSVFTTLDVVKRVFERVDGIYHDTAEMVKKVFARLLNLCLVLDLWVDIEIRLEEGLADPKILRKKGFEVLVTLLRGLGGNVLTTAGIVEASWRTLRVILNECLEVCHDLVSKTLHLSYPFTLTLFAVPRISDMKQEDLFETVQFTSFMYVFFVDVGCRQA
ncbi:hypothetical protein P691DRAFT_418307 [Macrolepiota fuliginosa MF-IS2]|uniref:Uncharacterized protein n=1 Tax=Macrolepiota fuliginosa MF-IS2 TaxID=1400762 RepID=A0A9P5XIF9_9AGAR|nr:hypothetical protein P691DRAFT_418307 [Macrolepiota fuliginosa MF-IS2]